MNYRRPTCIGCNAPVNCKACNSPGTFVLGGEFHGLFRWYQCEKCGVITCHTGPYDYGLIDKEDSQADQERFDAAVNWINARLGNLSSVLDIGCGAGKLLERLDIKRRVGVELNGLRRDAIPEGIERYSRIDELAGQQFDLVIMSHFLEHVEAPWRWLQIAREMALAVYVELPCVGLDSDFQIVAPPAHLHYFTEDSMRWMLSLNKLLVQDYSSETVGGYPCTRSLSLAAPYLNDYVRALSVTLSADHKRKNS